MSSIKVIAHTLPMKILDYLGIPLDELSYVLADYADYGIGN